jgi:hypothetical protein
MADEIKNDAFMADGISLGIPNSSATSIDAIDNAIFADSSGNLHFRDNFVKDLLDVNGNPIKSLTLEDLYTRVKGVYVVDGKLYFKDSSVARAYSLKEIADAYINWKNKLTSGGIFWIGNTRATNEKCENLIVNVEGDPNLGVNAPEISGVGRIYEKVSNVYPPQASGTKTFSIDEYLNGLTGDYKLDTDGTWLWHDIPNVKITIPPVDANKAIVIIAKTNIRLIKAEKPIVLRLYDVTTGEELDRKAVGNDTALPVEQQPVLTFFGALPTYAAKLEALACQCPTEEQKVAFKEEPPHEIIIQFHVDDKFDDSSEFHVYKTKVENISGSLFETVDDTTSIRYNGLERRLIGYPTAISDEPLVNSSIDVVIYDTNKNDSQGRKTGSKTFNNQDMVEVIFDSAFTNSEYSISLSCDKNINTWQTNKKSSGFIIRGEKKFSGTVDWIATKTRLEGNA